MILIKRVIGAAIVPLIIVLTSVSAFSQNQDVATGAKRVLWEPVNISERDLYWGPGGQQMQPVMEKAQYIGRQSGGNNLKHRLKDGAGREWVVKIADESQPEIVAVRMLWGIGYKTEIDYLIPKLEITKVGNYRNARFEARPENIKRLERWSWNDNPFIGTNEFEGLKIMMAMINNWDLKDENTVVLQDGDELHYVVSDLGSSFGKLAKTSTSRSGRSVNKPKHFAEAGFIKQSGNGLLEFDYRGKADYLMKGIKIEHGRWLADLLLQLSDKQIEDAFRAANYKEEDVKLLAQAFKARINELDSATKSASGMTNNN